MDKLTFKEVYLTQKELQKFMGLNLDEMSIKEKMSYVKEHSFWISDEISEMIHELPFMKPWSKKHEKLSDEELQQMIKNGKKEFVDVFTFFLNVMLGLNFDVDELFEMYMEKNKENINRQKNGY